MSKITFRADDDLIEQLEEFEASKSEVMRDALRTYLGGAEPTAGPDAASLDDIIAERVDAMVTERLERSFTPAEARDVNVNITLDGDSGTASNADVNTRKTGSGESVDASDTGRKTEATGRKTCSQCGEILADNHVYCPNCGEKSARRVFCECGDELRSDWSFCPGCGRRTPAADVLDNP